MKKKLAGLEEQIDGAVEALVTLREARTQINSMRRDRGFKGPTSSSNSTKNTKDEGWKGCGAKDHWRGDPACPKRGQGGKRGGRVSARIFYEFHWFPKPWWFSAWQQTQICECVRSGMWLICCFCIRQFNSEKFPLLKRPRFTRSTLRSRWRWHWQLVLPDLRTNFLWIQSTKQHFTQLVTDHVLETYGFKQW